MKTMNEEISKALSILRPGAEWILRGDTYSSLEWLDQKQSAPSWAEIEKQINAGNPIRQLTIEEKLASAGLSVNDLKTALGL